MDPLGWREDNPALKPRRLNTESDGDRPWTQIEFLQFMERSDENWQFHALLALLAAQCGQDHVAMLWTDYDSQQLYVAQENGAQSG